MSERAWATVSILKEDYAKIASDLWNDDTPCNRRTYIQRAFSLVESFASLMAQIALERPILFSSAEIATLERRPKHRLRCAEFADFAFRMFSRAMGSTYQLDKSRKEWNAFIRAMRARNRITHASDDLAVSDKEIDAMGLAYQMVVRAMVDSLVQGADATYLAVKELCQQNGIPFECGS